MRLVPGEPEGVDNRVSERGAHEGVAVIPTALMERERPHTRRRQIVAKPEPMQDAGRVRAHLDPRTDLAERMRLLVHVHVEPGSVERERSGEAADSAPDDSHGGRILHVTNDTLQRHLSPPASDGAVTQASRNVARPCGRSHAR